MLKEKIVYLENRDEIDEDAFQCKYCTDLCFLSMLSCKRCSKSEEAEEAEEKSAQEKGDANEKEEEETLHVSNKYASKQEKRNKALAKSYESNQMCTHHLNVCGCSLDNYVITYRFSTNELHQYMKLINEACG